tara:strand:- start:797 stop:970 length:174 start_codon:yes stop_codon:yes gene_type:complete
MPYYKSPINQRPMNEIRLEELAETIFEHMMESFKDLTPSEEQLVYECACAEATSQIS